MKNFILLLSFSLFVAPLNVSAQWPGEAGGKALPIPPGPPVTLPRILPRLARKALLFLAQDLRRCWQKTCW